MIVPAASRLLTISSGAIAAAWGWWQLDASPGLFWRNKLQQSAKMPHPQRLWIIGASSGIGEEFAYQWVDRQPSGSHLILSSRSEDRLQAIASTCRQRNPDCQVHVHPMDVTSSPEQLSAFVQSLPVRQIDTVWLNAGQGQLATCTETTPYMVQQTVQANALWPILLTPFLLEHGVFSQTNQNGENKPAHIMVTSSVAGKVAVPLSAVYAASKHFLHGYFRSLVAESALSVDLLCPGPIDTAFSQNRVALSEKESSSPSSGSDGSSLSQSNSSSKLKMTSPRCASLILTAYQNALAKKGIREVWISPQPALTVLYVQQFFPSLAQWAINRVGAKRVELYQRGLDLYDPESWKK